MRFAEETGIIIVMLLTVGVSFATTNSGTETDFAPTIQLDVVNIDGDALVDEGYVPQYTTHVHAFPEVSQGETRVLYVCSMDLDGSTHVEVTPDVTNEPLRMAYIGAGLHSAMLPAGCSSCVIVVGKITKLTVEDKEITK